MSAADLFKNVSDVEFRLTNTFIMIGKEPYYVRQVINNGVTQDVKEAVLRLTDREGGERLVPLRRLPLRAMSASPCGYSDGQWVARGPARHRFQGMTHSSFWAVRDDGRLAFHATDNVFSTLKELASQPKTRRSKKQVNGALTRDVFVDSMGRVLVRGVHRGDIAGANLVKPLGEILPLTRRLLENAQLRLLPKSVEKPENLAAPIVNKIEDNPCSEIEL